MKIIQGDDRVHTLLRLYSTVWSEGVAQTVRGQKILNVRDLAVEMDMNEGPVFTNFKVRNFNLSYAKREWLWYLGADKYDSSIEQYATMWKKLKQQDGSYYSNYGQYLFGLNLLGDGRYPEKSQFDYVIDTLKGDESSRRASMALLKQEHLFEANTDVVCTYAINFAIEGMHLHMTVMMRSNDVIFGFTNDAFCFGELYEFVYQRLRDETYGWLKRGTYTHLANSMHVYERHFEMIEQIIMAGRNEFSPIYRPEPTPAEVRDLVKSNGKVSYGEYSNWLKT